MSRVPSGTRQHYRQHCFGAIDATRNPQPAHSTIFSWWLRCCQLFRCVFTLFTSLQRSTWCSNFVSFSTKVMYLFLATANFGYSKFVPWMVISVLHLWYPLCQLFKVSTNTLQLIFVLQKFFIVNKNFYFFLNFTFFIAK